MEKKTGKIECVILNKYYLFNDLKGPMPSI